MKNLNKKIFHNGKLAMTIIMAPRSTFDLVDTNSPLIWWEEALLSILTHLVVAIAISLHSPLGMGGSDTKVSLKKCGTDVDKLSTPIFFEGESTDSLLGDVIFLKPLFTYF